MLTFGAQRDNNFCDLDHASQRPAPLLAPSNAEEPASVCYRSLLACSSEDHWEPKNHKGPSDAQAEGGRDTNRETKGGVDANATKEHLMDVAKRLDISGRSKMSKDELVDAIQKANDKETAEARTRG